MNLGGRWSSWVSVTGDTLTAPLVVYRLDGRTDALRSYSYNVRAVKSIGDGPLFDTTPDTAFHDLTDNPRQVMGATILAPRNIRVVPTQNGNASQLIVSWNRVASTQGGRQVD